MFLRAVKAALLASLILVAFGSFWMSLELHLPSAAAQKKILLEIEKGKGAASIAEALRREGVIRKKTAFLLACRWLYSSQSLKAGEYLFQAPLPLKEVIQTLADGKIHLHPLTIPEGLTLREIAGMLAQIGLAKEEDCLKAFSDNSLISAWDPKARDLEGYLFPETYFFPRGISAEEVTRALVSEFQKAFGEGWRIRCGVLGMSTREIVILASLIEKEAALSRERTLVSSVFHNRLRLGMKLDCDPTIIYALKLKGQYEGRLSSRDLDLPSPYNTYLFRGLPPGPICNPGKESLRSALYPAKTDYLYFVSRNDGSHEFNSEIESHQNAVRKYQIIRKSSISKK
jgi:UPF0755 protein